MHAPALACPSCRSSAPPHCSHLRQRYWAEQVHLSGPGGTLVSYLRLHYFSSQASKDLAAAILDGERLGVDGYILDLRNNPGGILVWSPDFVPASTLVKVSMAETYWARDRLHAHRFCCDHGERDAAAASSCQSQGLLL